jgi:hypothetical protein
MLQPPRTLSALTAAVMDCNFGRAEVDDLGYKAYDAIEKL